MTDTYLFHRIGERLNSNFNTKEEIAGLPKGEVITFDGVYDSILEVKNELFNHHVTLFVTGSYVGHTNEFDKGQPLGRFLDWNEIVKLCSTYGCDLGWHTWTHRDLTTLSRAEKWKEIQPPFPMDYFAYPYGRFDDECLELVRLAGYKEAFSVNQGDDSRYQRRRKYLNW